MPPVMLPACTAAAMEPAARNPVDGLQMVSMSALHAGTAIEVHAERRPEQVGFEVVNRQRVAGQQGLHVARADQRRQVRAAAGVDHHRSGHHHGATLAGADAAHFESQFANLAFGSSFGGHLRRHECEFTLRVARIGDVYTHTGLAAYDLVAANQVAHQRATSVDVVAVLVLYDDGGVHALALDTHPVAGGTHVGRIDRRAAEILRCDAIPFDGREHGWIALAGDGCAERPQQIEGLIEPRLIRGR